MLYQMVLSFNDSGKIVGKREISDDIGLSCENVFIV